MNARRSSTVESGKLRADGILVKGELAWLRVSGCVRCLASTGFSMVNVRLSESCTRDLAGC